MAAGRGREALHCDVAPIKLEFQFKKFEDSKQVACVSSYGYSSEMYSGESKRTYSERSS